MNGDDPVRSSLRVMEIAAVPLKQFDLAKARMAVGFDATQREKLGRAVAAHTLDVVAGALGAVWVVTSDAAVADWAGERGARIILERRTGLNAAASRVIELAGAGRWMILHSDLPLLTSEDVSSAWNGIPRDGFLLAPSRDGGTSVVAGEAPAPSLAYGPGSFHRHLAGVRRYPVQVITRTGFLLDVDAPSDYAAAARHPRGSWLDRAIGR